MKNIKVILFSFAFLATALTFSACGNSGDNADQQGKEYTSAYVCPMHCEGSGSDQPGKCPVCGMDYVKNEKAANHDHDHDGHEGHQH
ncbi:MAG: hypothetical protein D6714_07505 [Bacteroidetes bacterium]|nr:MAG: hypothetical protein D6714_07505 [Bacteroidota bacterium]